MADLDDVCNALVGMVAAIVYPNGTAQPSVASCDVKIYQGWPVEDQLDLDLKAGIAQISIYPSPQERNTSRYPREWQLVSMNTPTLTLTVTATNGTSWDSNGVTFDNVNLSVNEAAKPLVTVSGNIPPPSNPHNVMVAVNRIPYVYAVQPNDTISSIAASLAALIAAAVPGTASAGPVISCPANTQITVVRVGVTGTSAREVRRQERLFQIGIWASNPTIRTALASAIDLVLADTEFFTLPDQFSARLIYKNSRVSDNEEKQGLYRRDLFYTVEYATTQTVTSTQITQIEVNLSGSP